MTGHPSTNQKVTLPKKQILSDPVAAFSSLRTGPSAQTIEALEKLRQRLRLLKSKHKEMLARSGVISRQIGEAKRNGKSIENLMTSMQAQSARLKHTKYEISELENRILAFFDPGYDEAPAANSCMPEKRTFCASKEFAEQVTVSLLSNELEEWNRYVTANPASSIYHRAEWRDLIRKTFGHEVFLFSARDPDGSIVGVLPLTRLKSRLFGDFLVSVPYFNYGGAIGDHPLIEQKLMQAANELAAALGVSHIEYRDDVPREGIPTKTDKVNMLLPLPANEDALWNGFPAKLRAQIRRPQRENPQVLWGGKEYLDDFYAVFARNMRDLGTPVYGRYFFANILDTFPQESRLIVLRLNDRPVAAAFLIGQGERLEIPWASSIKDVNHLSMNMLMYWEVLRFAIREGFRYFDFGRSTRDAGTYRFKLQWGAQPVQLHWHYWLMDGCALPALNPSNPKYALMINIWKRLPVSLTKLIGPGIVKHLP